MEVVQSSNSAWFCELCSLQFDGIKVFDMHQRLIHGIEEKEIQIKEEPLEDSPKDDLEENKKENLVQLLQRSHQCPHCESLFTRKDNLISHIASVHERKKPYQCTDCNQSYAKKDNLKVHVAAIHEGKKLNKCPDCEASFAQKTQMLNHINSVHEGIKSFECTTCKAKFARKAHLIRHIESVHEEKKSPVVQKDVILFKSAAVTNVQLKQGFGIGNRSPISISLAVTQKERKDIARQDLQPYEAARSCTGPKNSTTKSHVIEGSKFKELPVKRGRGRPPKPKDPLTDMEKNDGTAATRGRPAVKDISTNWHCIEDKVERAKQQNVEASRRFRKNKKSRMQNIESVEQDVAAKNKKLKGILLDLERRRDTLRILMLEKCRQPGPTSNITTTTPNNSIQIPETIQEPNASYDSNTELIIDETFEDPELVIDEKVDDDSELIIDEHVDEHIDEHVDEHIDEDVDVDEHLGEHELIIDEHIDEPELKIDENMDSMPTQETKAILIENYMKTTVHDRQMPQVIIPKNLIKPPTTRQLQLLKPIGIQCSMKNLETNENTTIARTEIFKVKTPKVDSVKTEMGEFHVKEAEQIKLEPTENSTKKQLELVQPIVIQCLMKNLETNENTTIAIPRTEIIKAETPEVDPLKTEMVEFHVKQAVQTNLEPTENSETDEGYHTGTNFIPILPTLSEKPVGAYPTIPVIKKVPSENDKKALKKLRNISASRKYMANKRAREKAEQFEEESIKSKNAELKSQVTQLEQKIETIKTLMKEFGVLKQGI